MPEARGLLITRPEPGASSLADWALAEGFSPVTVSPVLEAETLAVPAPGTEDLDAVVLTSATGARAAPASAALRALPCWCVGEATAQAAREAGFARAEAGPGDAEELAAAILARHARGERLLHLRGRHGGETLEAALTAGGLRLESVAVYRMRAAEALSPEAEAGLSARAFAVAAAYSPRSGRVLAQLLGGRHDLSGTVLAAISVAAAEPLCDLGFRKVRIADAPRGPEMRDAIRASVAGNG